MTPAPSLRPAGCLILALGLAAGAPVGAAAADDNNPDPERPIVFQQPHFDQLAFLLGDWRGTAPDGSVFYERYQRGGPAQLQSLRFASDAFADATDGSTLRLQDGAIEARWGEFTWQASRIGPTEACFEPVDAPSAFCWQAEGPDRLTVIQRWTDADGAEQSARIVMTRINGAR